ncbi:hypothetical protein B1207_02515 [Legionella quinlivanii]|uniref:Uncharacterized protein n=1 Tax=Legionella quinlivanii TaxID=45073 RepID=A0A364LM06_9GAMM|nr:hypothetical protein [Legionella quinlivanii]RAP37880.1 hypothetical protein B1207_02515 [Legionella quinlivanii]
MFEYSWRMISSVCQWIIRQLEIDSRTYRRSISFAGEPPVVNASHPMAALHDNSRGMRQESDNTKQYLAKVALHLLPD